MYGTVLASRVGTARAGLGVPLNGLMARNKQDTADGTTTAYPSWLNEPDSYKKLESRHDHLPRNTIHTAVVPASLDLSYDLR